MNYQAAPFEPIRSFDMPSVIVNQALEGNISFEALQNLALPSRRAYLPPEQQES